MDSKSKERRGGSFREVRKQHLPLFDPSVHRHDRGWRHAPDGVEERPAELLEGRPRRDWKRAGIFHFRDDGDVGD